MLTRTFQELELSQLGFGAMRLPLLPDGQVDEAQVREMVADAMAQGVNYFDTAYPYHRGDSERVMGRVLGAYPRESYCLATKFPGHQISETYDPEAIFEEQLQKCGVTYFDFYLLHNVYEHSLATYTDARWNIVPYLIEQKRRGRIRHLGFSSHGGLEVLERFLDLYGQEMEFCQIQLNYLDWTLQNARAKYELLTRRGVPVWVMEPVRGGRLASLTPEQTRRLSALRPDAMPAEWAFRFLQELPNVTMILSGMSNRQQMRENLATFAQARPLLPAERETLLALAEEMKAGVPCTACRYCCDGCPRGLEIPLMLEVYNELQTAPSVNASMRIEALPPLRQPGACIGCGKCAQVCPQGIDIPRRLRELADLLTRLPTWAEVCRQRAKEQR